MIITTWKTRLIQLTLKQCKLEVPVHLQADFSQLTQAVQLTWQFKGELYCWESAYAKSQLYLQGGFSTVWEDDTQQPSIFKCQRYLGINLTKSV